MQTEKEPYKKFYSDLSKIDPNDRKILEDFINSEEVLAYDKIPKDYSRHKAGTSKLSWGTNTRRVDYYREDCKDIPQIKSAVMQSVALMVQWEVEEDIEWFIEFLLKK